MAGLDDRLRGYKKENLVGDSDSEDEQGGRAKSDGAAANVPLPAMDGIPKTGPKGVLADYYRQMVENQKLSVLDDENRKKMIKKHSATVQPHSAEKAAEMAAEKKKEKAAENSARVNVAKALQDGSLDQDKFMKSFRATRMAELKKQASLGSERKRFGSLMEIRGGSYASVIDNCPTSVTLIIHIYNELYQDCARMNVYLTKMAKMYPTVKICRVQSVSLDLSETFKESGLPTLMVYRDGEAVGNFPRIVDNIGKVYELEDLEHFLRDKDCLPAESEKEDSYFSMSSGGAMKLLGVSRPTQSDSEDD